MLVTLLGIMTSVRLVQSSNASSPMFFTLLGIVTLVKPAQPMKAAVPMLVTLLGIVTLVKEAQLRKAPSMLVTGRPLMVSGMVSATPGPVYPVIVIEPL